MYTLSLTFVLQIMMVENPGGRVGLIKEGFAIIDPFWVDPVSQQQAGKSG